MHKPQSWTAHPSGSLRPLRLKSTLLIAAWFAGLLAAALMARPVAVFGAGAIASRAGVPDLSAARRQMSCGEYRQCIAAAADALRSASRAEDWACLKAEAELAVGESHTAVQTVEAGLKRTPLSIRLRLLGHRALQRSGETGRAQEMLQQIDGMARRAPWRYGKADDLLALGEAVLMLGADPQFVLESFYEPALKLEPHGRAAYAAIGRLALDRHDFKLAAEILEDAAERFPTDAEIQYGLALAWAADRPEQSRQALDKALDLNPHLHPALLFRVDRLIDAERYDEAGRLLDRVQQVNPHDPDAWAFRAVVAHLSNEPLRETACRTKALRHWDKNPAVDHLIGLKLSQKYRFAEGAAYQRQALELDPQFVPARVQLCQDLLRLGQEDEGWKLAEEVHDAHRHDVVTHNLLELRDRIAKFRTLESEDFIVRMAADEADVYGERVLALLGRAKRALCEKYGLELDDKVTVEIFPDESDFAVRTFGMPGESGFLGVCFGKVITANSPASQTEQPANWEAVLWHEFCHVVTLELTQNRMPRWLSEGISVYEESQANPAWGQSMNPQYRALILGGELTPVSELSGAFVSPESPQHVQFAYYESALVVEYLIERHGLETLQDVLRDLKAGLSINVALDRRTDGLASLEREFARFARRKAEALAPGVDFDDPDASAVTSDDPAELEQWVRRNPRNFAGLMCRAQALLDEEAWEQARAVLERAVRLYPGYVGNDNAYEMLAFAYRQLDRPDDERRVLVRYAERDCIALRAFLRLLELQVEAEDWTGALQTAERAMAVNPMLPQPYRVSVRAAEALGRSDEAMLAYRTLLSIRTEEEPDRTRVGALPRPEGVHGTRGERGTRIR